MFTYVAQRKTTGAFLEGFKNLADKRPRETFDLNKAIHRNTEKQAFETAKHELGKNVKHFQIVKVFHELSVVLKEREF